MDKRMNRMARAKLTDVPQQLFNDDPTFSTSPSGYIGQENGWKTHLCSLQIPRWDQFLIKTILSNGCTARKAKMGLSPAQPVIS